MLYHILADVVVITHLLFIFFVVIGGLGALRWRWIPWLHLPALAWGAGLEFFGWICPLTTLENSLRQAGGSAGYAGGFIEHYLMPIIYPPGLNRTVQILLGIGVVVINLAIYGLVYRRSQHSRNHR